MTYQPANIIMTPEKEPPIDRIHPFDPAEFPQARQHGTAGREEIREVTHRVMGSRQSPKTAERSNQPRQPKTGGKGHNYRKGGEKKD